LRGSDIRLLLRARLPSRPTADAIHLAIKMVIAGTLAWWLCTLLGAERPLFAVLVPLVAMDGDPFASVSVSAGRVLGVFVGVLVGLAVVQLSLPSTLLVALLLVLSLLAGLLLRVGESPLNNQIAISAMFILYVGTVSKAQAVGLARIWETALGAAIAVAVSALIWPPNPLAESRRRVARLRQWLREDLGTVGELLEHPDAERAEEELELVRERSLQAVRDVFELERGERALRWNPRRRTDLARFTVERGRLTSAARQYRHVRAIARLVADAAADEPPLPGPDREQLTGAIALLTAAQLDGHRRPQPLDPSSLHDPRAVGLAVKLGQMVEDLAPA
jgi:uncharacterized membrane protein YgaE (UPF0421/DUF939 family)